MLKGTLTALSDLLPPFNSEELEKQELFCRNFLCSPGELKCVNKDSMFSRVHNVQNRKTRSGTAVHFNISLLRIPCFCWFDHAEANSIWHSNIFCLRYCFLWFNIFLKGDCMHWRKYQSEISKTFTKSILLDENLPSTLRAVQQVLRLSHMCLFLRLVYFISSIACQMFKIQKCLFMFI